QRQHETPSPFLIVPFANQTPGDLPRVLVARGEQADVWPTKRQRHAERLTFGDDNVSTAGAGRLQQTERHGFGDCDNQECSGGMSFVSERLNIFDATEEVWRLDDDRSGLVVN